MSIYEEIVQAEKENKVYAVATIVRTIGCSPRSAGTKMLVYDDGSTSGTVGGGTAERLVTEDALECMRSGKTLLKRYSPDGNKEADCEKIIEVFIEPGIVLPHLYFLGSGHVAQAVIPYAKKMGFYISVLDTQDTAPYAEFLEGADEIVKIDDFLELGELPIVRGGYFIVCTSSHGDDGKALEGVLKLDCGPSYIGLLGAKHKFVPLYKRLLEAGYPEETLRSVYAPVGLDIGGENLDEIGLGIMAELLMVKYGRDGGSMRDKRAAGIWEAVRS